MRWNDGSKRSKCGSKAESVQLTKVPSAVSMIAFRKPSWGEVDRVWWPEVSKNWRAYWSPLLVKVVAPMHMFPVGAKLVVNEIWPPAGAGLVIVKTLDPALV